MVDIAILRLHELGLISTEAKVLEKKVIYFVKYFQGRRKIGEPVVQHLRKAVDLGANVLDIERWIAKASDEIDALFKCSPRAVGKPDAERFKFCREKVGI